MSMIHTTYDSVYIVIIMVIATTFGIFMYGQTIGAFEEAKEIGNLIEDKVYFGKVLTAPCLSANNVKNEPKRYIYDVDKLNEGDLSCLDLEENYYSISVEDIDTSEKWGWSVGDIPLEFKFNQTISILDGEEMHIGFVKFGICKPEECE